MIPFIHVCKRDEQLFAKWLRHAKDLGMPDMVVWAEPGVKVDHKIDRVFQSSYGYPEITTHIWHEACTTLREPVLYLETDAWPVAVNWCEAIAAEYENCGRPPALITASAKEMGSPNPPDHVCCGIAVYDAQQLSLGSYQEFRQRIPYGLAWDWWIPQQAGIQRTSLIRHSYGIYGGGHVIGFHAFHCREHFQRMCGGAAIFHKDAFGTCARWVDGSAAQSSGATPPDLSETGKHRDWFLPYTQGYGIDLGYGGDPIVPHAICFDMPQPYTSVGSAPQHLGGDARKLLFKSGVLDWVYASHLIEDFTYGDQIIAVKEWLRVLKPGGRLLILAPDQQRFEAHCSATGQSINAAHKEADYSLKTFKKRVLRTGNIRAKVLAEQDFADYSWAIVLETDL